MKTLAQLKDLVAATDTSSDDYEDTADNVIDVTTEVDENGAPVSPEVQAAGKRDHDDDDDNDDFTAINATDTQWISRMKMTALSTCELTEYTTSWKDASKVIPYCPVYVAKTQDDGALVATAYITGQVADLSEYVDLVDLLEVMTKRDVLTIYIDSPGGYVATGAAIASCVDSCKGKVIGVARGLCASAGSLIWSACHICLVEPFANFMYHMSSHYDMGNSEGMRERAAIQVAYVEHCLLNVALSKGHITSEEMIKISRGKENIFISAQDMSKRIGRTE